MKKIKLLLSLGVILLSFSCKKSDDKNTSYNQGDPANDSVNVSKKESCHPPIPELLAQIMIRDFKENVLDKKIINESELLIDKNIYESIINNFPADSDILNCTFVESNQSLGLDGKYSGLSSFNNRLLILFNYDKSKINTKYHLIANGKDIIIDEFDAGMMHSLYNTTTRSKLDIYAKNYGKNTMKVKIPKHCLQEYIKNSASNSSLKEYRFVLGKIPHWDADLENFLQTKSEKEVSISTREISMLKNRYVNNEGQITFITNAYDANGNIIGDLSYYDLNSLSPPN